MDSSNLGTLCLDRWSCTRLASLSSARRASFSLRFCSLALSFSRFRMVGLDFLGMIGSSLIPMIFGPQLIRTLPKVSQVVHCTKAPNSMNVPGAITASLPYPRLIETPSKPSRVLSWVSCLFQSVRRIPEKLRKELARLGSL